MAASKQARQAVMKARAARSKPKLSAAEAAHLSHVLTVHSSMAQDRLTRTVSELRSGRTPTNIKACSTAMDKGAKSMHESSPYVPMHKAVQAKIAKHVTR